MLALYIGLQAKMVLNLKIFCQILRKFKDTTSSNSLLIIVLSDFNETSLFWWNRGKTTIEGTRLESLIIKHVFHQLISQPTHLLLQTSFWFDLIFTDQPNLIVDGGDHPSLHSNCHHQITYCKVNLSIEYEPPQVRLVWNHSRANAGGIKNSLGLSFVKKCSIMKVFTNRYLFSMRHLFEYNFKLYP